MAHRHYTIFSHHYNHDTLPPSCALQQTITASTDGVLLWHIRASQSCTFVLEQKACAQARLACCRLDFCTGIADCHTISSRAGCRLCTGTVVTPTTANFHIMKPRRPVIICLASSTWVVVVPELSGLQFWMAQMPVRANAVMNPNLRPGLPVMRCMASAIGTRCISAQTERLMPKINQTHRWLCIAAAYFLPMALLRHAAGSTTSRFKSQSVDTECLRHQAQAALIMI